MAIEIRQDGTFSIEYEGPYAGLDTLKPETLISDKSTPSVNGFMLRNAELRSWPALTQWPSNASPASFSGVPLATDYFIDANGIYHVCTIVGSSGGGPPALLQWNSTSGQWVIVGQAGPLAVTLPISIRSFANLLYYSAIGFAIGGRPRPGGGGGSLTVSPFVGFWDGIAAAPVFTQTFSDASTSNSIAGISKTDSPTVGGSLPGAPVVVGPLAIGGGFLGELNNQLILANVSVLDQNNSKVYNFPNLIWWSANGLPLQWDPTPNTPLGNTSAGFNAFLDVPDQITGFATIGIAGYLFRTNGITQMTPTGSGQIPWLFEHMWASDRGIGNVAPWSIASYGPTCAFVANDNIYSINVTQVAPIGGTARDAIFTDLTASTSEAFATIVPFLQNGFTYLTYQLFIPFPTFTRMYVYSFDEQNWTVRDLASITVTSIPTTV